MSATFYVRVNDNPNEEGYGEALSLHRWIETEDQIYLHRWDKKSRKWVDNPNLLAATGMGGDHDYVRVSEEEAAKTLAKLGGDAKRLRSRE